MRRLSWTSRVALACSVLLLTPLAWPLATGRIIPTGDIGSFHIPVRHLYQEALRAGDSLLWTPALFAGYYLHGEGQIGMLHPLHLLLYGVLPLDVAVNLEMLATYVAAFAGMFWFLRRLQFAQDAALFGAMLFAFSGFQVLHFQHLNVTAVVAHIPWLLAFADRLLVGPGSRDRAAGFAGIGVVLASAALLGFPQALWWNLLTLSAFALFRAAELGRWRYLPLVAAAGVAGLLAGGIQILPTLDVAAESTRTLLPRTFAFAHSLHPWNVIQWWSPAAFVNRGYNPLDPLQPHEIGIYSGAILAIAPVWLWLRRGTLGGRRRLAAYAVLFAGVMFVLALGRHGGLYELVTYLPGIGSLRAPARYIVLVQFALIVLAAIVYEDLAARSKPRATLTAGWVVALSAIALASVLTTWLLNARVLQVRGDLPLAPVAQAAAGTAIIIGITVVFLLAARQVRWALPLLICVTAADLWIWGTPYVRQDSPQTLEWLTSGIPPPVPDPGVRYVIPDGWANRLTLKDYRSAYGYAGLFPIINMWSRITEFHQLAGVRWRIAPDHAITPVSGAVPRARLVAEARIAYDVPGMAGHVDLHRTALVNRPLPALSGTPGTASVIVDRPGRLTIETMTGGRQLLVVSERFHNGWSCTVEGRTAQTVTVHGDFLGCVIEQGRHRVELRFRPRSFIYGGALSALGILGLAAGTVFLSRKEDVSKSRA